MTRRRLLPLATAGLFAITWSPARAIALDESTPPPHVRPEKELRPLVEEATRRSPSVRALIDELERTDVTVYIRARAFAQPDLEGRVGFLATIGSHRILVIELACGRHELSQMATLAHELFHATEIAAEPSVVDVRTLAALYARIGIQTSSEPGRKTFETEAAAAAGERTRRELWSHTAKSTPGT